jgi:hypothetical protein
VSKKARQLARLEKKQAYQVLDEALIEENFRRNKLLKKRREENRSFLKYDLGIEDKKNRKNSSDSSTVSEDIENATFGSDD